MMATDEQFIERPYENERDKALTYVASLIDQASKDPKNRQEDINQLLTIQKLLNGKRYGLVWEEHEEKVDKEMKTKIPVFKEDHKRIIHGDKQSYKYNFLLVGDNLHSLHLLEKTHRSRVNVICIDPPYNTQNKDFKYNDKFVDSSDEYVHSKWISFMYRRLTQAKKLLTYDGVIMINIDNNEYANLKLLMDQVFPNGYVTTIHVEMSTVQGMKVRSAKNGNIVKNAEYILVYSKDGHHNVMKHPLYNRTNYDHHYNQFLTKENNYYNCRQISEVLQEHQDITRQLEALGLVNKSHSLSNSKIGVYYDSSELVREFINKNADLVVRDHTSVTIKNNVDYLEGKVYPYFHGKRKYLIQKNKDGKYTQKIPFSTKLGKSDDFKPEYGPLKIRGDWWKDFYLDMGNVNKEGGVKLSNGKKPLRLIKQLLKATTDKDDIVLDFFAGSGTTGQAVLDLNKEDGGHREIILCTNNESKIAEKITYQRMKNVNDGYGKYAANPFNMKYFKTAFVDKDSTNLEKELLKNVKTLIELQYGINFEDSNFRFVTNQKEVAKQQLKGVSKVFMRGRVHKMMSPEEQDRYSLANVQIIDIPETFFGKELQGWM